jgi:hypothetical protein
MLSKINSSQKTATRITQIKTPAVTFISEHITARAPAKHINAKFRNIDDPPNIKANIKGQRIPGEVGKHTAQISMPT